MSGRHRAPLGAATLLQLHGFHDLTGGRQARDPVQLVDVQPERGEVRNRVTPSFDGEDPSWAKAQVIDVVGADPRRAEQERIIDTGAALQRQPGCQRTVGVPERGQVRGAFRAASRPSEKLSSRTAPRLAASSVATDGDRRQTLAVCGAS